MLGAAQLAHFFIGDKATNIVGRALHDIGLPLWTASLPRPRVGKIPSTPPQMRRVVYFPSCINRTMGASADSKEEFSGDLINQVVHLCAKAGYEVIFPDNMGKLCCGMIWESKGMPDIANRKTAELDEALWQASGHGRWPVVCDQSPCLHRMREHIKRVRLYEMAEFIEDCLVPHLEFRPTDKPVAVHITCSTRRMGLAGKLVSLAGRCSTKVLVPQEIGCCGFAGDKGFTHPELNAWGLRKLRPQITAFGATEGYSNSRTCEIGLSTNSGIPYKSIVYLVNQVTSSKLSSHDQSSNKTDTEK